MRALLFDVFGTCVDWRTSIRREAARFGLPQELAQAWRDQYQPQLETVRSGRRPWVNLDVLHRIGLDKRPEGPRAARSARPTAPSSPTPGTASTRGPTSSKASPGSRRRFIIAPCSNGHIAQSVNLAKYAKLPWDAILGAEIARAYKPDPRVYEASVDALGLEPRRGLHGRRAPRRPDRRARRRPQDRLRPAPQGARGSTLRRRLSRPGTSWSWPEARGSTGCASWALRQVTRERA